MGLNNKLIRFILAYPNTPYIAMSALGWQYIYRELAIRGDVHCETLFLSDEQKLISHDIKQAVKKADIIGFSIQYELDYINVVKMLELADVPLKSIERNDSHPLIIAGGPAVSANPAPLSDFIDLFVLGEGEEIIHEIMDIIKNNDTLNKTELLTLLQKQVNGLYVGAITGDYPDDKTKIRKVPDYAQRGCSSLFFTKDTEFPDTLLLELTRGCTQGCKFCLASYLYHPFRYADLDSVINTLEEKKRITNKVGLVGASICDYPELDKLCEYLLKNNWQASTSSLRIDKLKPSILELLHTSNNRMITVAIETGSEKLRKRIGKNITDEQILKGVEFIGKSGFKKLKVYAIFGLPEEKEEDILALINLFKQIQKTGQKNGIKNLILNINPFIPKKLTPFQNVSMTSYKELLNKQTLLKKELTKFGVSVKGESINWSIIQGKLATGDKNMGEIIFQMAQNRSGSIWKGILKTHK